ncbi:molybdopterin cofactor-binding domain-containing protein [Escherichia coli]
MNPPAFGCTFVDLTVDIALCKVTINRILNVHDSGQILNPLLAEGQVHGGMGRGIGWALFEEMIIMLKAAWSVTPICWITKCLRCRIRHNWKARSSKSMSRNPHTDISHWVSHQ